MKKQVIIFFLLTGIYQQSFCQKSFTATVPCSDSLLMSIKGSYVQTPDIILNDFVLGNVTTFSVLPKAQQPEAFRRMDAMHKLLAEAYPEPKGLVGNWHHYMNVGLFASNIDNSKGIPVCAYEYNCGFGYYCCIPTQPNEVDYEGDFIAQLNVYVNHLGPLQSDFRLDTMSINGQKVYMLNSIIGSWKGYDTYGEPGTDHRSIILTRKGESPLIPVTRKQYLNYCLSYFNNFFDEQLNFSNAMPVRSLEEQEALKKKALEKIEEDYKNNPKARDAIRKNFLETYRTDQQASDETTKKIIKTKNDVIKRYERELEKTKVDNLLDSPAVVFSIFTITDNTPIFATGSEGGKMLVVENPSYFKKELPKYMPQFMVLEWKWTSMIQSKYFRKIVEEYFPIEKLHAMIDK